MSKVTPRQKELLADFMSEHYIFLFGKFSKSSGKQAKEKKWEEITKLLNDNGPPNKNSEKWKRVRVILFFRDLLNAIIIAWFSLDIG